MNCFYHRDVVALGVCRNCQRGICTECIAEVVPNGIACAGRCEAAAAKAGRMWAKSESLNRMWGYVCLIFGLGFAAGGFYSWWLDRYVGFLVVFLVGIGLIYVGVGIAILIRLRTSRAD